MAIIGIDLGTTNSLVAHWSENGPVIIPNVLGAKLTPSVVGLDDNQNIVVGQVAKERLQTHPDRTIATFKRYMGTQKIFKLGSYKFTPEELSSFILKALKEDAENFLGEPIEEAIISVPAYFNDLQRNATKRAAVLAGLKVERLISEPTAAALAYGIDQKDTETKFMVFDLGGGTFDVSIIEIFEDVLEVKSIAGDNHLGGEDFTEALVGHFTEQHHIDFNLLTIKEKAVLHKQAELCKKGLTESDRCEMRFTYNGMEFSKRYKRDEYEQIVGKLLLKLLGPIERAMRDAKVSPKELETILMVGGATKMQVIRSAVGRIFGKLPQTYINPDETVALGAAIQAALKGRNRAFEELILTDVCPYSMGVSVARAIDADNYEAGYFSPIIERNSPIPISRVKSYYTLIDNQDTIHFKIFQGESLRTEDNLSIGEIVVSIPKRKKGEEAVDVRFTYDINGILEVESVVRSTGLKKQLIIKNGECHLSDFEIEQRLRQLQEIKIHPRDKLENQLLIVRCERLYEAYLGERREYVAQVLMMFKRALETQDEDEIKRASNFLKENLASLEGWFELE